MIKSIELDNFKAFKNSGIIDIKKINILVGPNSSGKSSFIKSLLALKNSTDNKESDAVLGFDKDIGTFNSVIYNNDVTNKIGYNINFKKDDISDINSIGYMYGMTLFKIASAINEKTKNTDIDVENILTNLLIENKKYKVENIKFTSKLTSSGRVQVDLFVINFINGDCYKIHKKRNSYYIKVNDEEISVPNVAKPYKYYFKIDINKLSKLSAEELKKIAVLDYAINQIERKISTFTDNIIYIEPLRNKLDRVEYVTNLKLYNSVGKKGENTLTTLISIRKIEDEKDTYKEKTTEKINYWLNEFDLGESIEIRTLGNDNYSLFIKNKHTGVYNNIMDVGVGTSQLIPIIIESINSKKGSTLIIEEPETHIHPNAQSKLADLFVECSKNQNKNFIIETHSIFLVTQLQILVAQKKINPDDVRVYYFSQDKDGSKAINMQMLDNGQFEEEWPEGFFDIHYKLGKKLFDFM